MYKTHKILYKISIVKITQFCYNLRRDQPDHKHVYMIFYRNYIYLIEQKNTSICYHQLISISEVRYINYYIDMVNKRNGNRYRIWSDLFMQKWEIRIKGDYALLEINQIQNIGIYFYNIILHSYPGFNMQRQQLFHNQQSTLNKPINHLHSIFDPKLIVQSYAQRNNHHFILDPSQEHTNPNLRPNKMFIQHQEDEHYPKKNKRFAEDDFFGELHSAHIVENFCMMDQKDEVYDQFQKIYKGRGQKPSYMNQDMLASSSQNNDVPSRNSSLSSLSQKNQIVNRGTNRSFMHDESVDKSIKKNCVKSSLTGNRRNNENNYQPNSQNQMDIQNSPYEGNSPNSFYLNNKISNKNQNIYIPPQINSRLQFARNNAFIPPLQKTASFPTFRRLDIDEEREKQQRLHKIQKIQQIGCNCKKSKCLKMYCECFNLQIFCNQNCNCVGCCNQQSNSEHKKAVLDALTRNPKAFNEVTQKIQASFQLGVELTEVKKGCKCKKTKCQKKYCECYNSGEICGKFCKCQGCQNC